MKQPVVETDLAWAAGIIDGEGYIGMTRQPAGQQGRLVDAFQVRMDVRMTHQGTIERLASILGGIVKPGSRVRDPKRHRPTWEWFVGDRDTYRILPLILPYLTTKRAQALMVLDFRARCFPPRPARGKHVISLELLSLRQSYFDQMAILNKRGI